MSRDLATFVVLLNVKYFPERLKELRIEKGLSHRDLAKAIDISKSAISHYENKIRVPSAEVIVLLAKYFKVSSDYLLGLED